MKYPIYLLSTLLLLAACSKDEDEDATSVSISSVNVITMPMVAPDGTDWDNFLEGGAGADLYFTIETPGYVLYKWNTGKLAGNIITADLPIRFDLEAPYLLASLNRAYTIRLYDYDNLSGDDLVAEAVFYPDQEKQARPSVKTISGAGCRIELRLNWR